MRKDEEKAKSGKMKQPEPAYGPRETPEAEAILASEPEGEDEAPPQVGDFGKDIAAWLTGGRLLGEVGALVVRSLPHSASSLAKFREEFEKHVVARSRAGSCTEILPVSLKAVESSQNWARPEGAWVSLICLALNYQFCGGLTNKKFMEHADVLNDRQLKMISDHLLPAVSRLCGHQKEVPSTESSRKRATTTMGPHMW